MDSFSQKPQTLSDTRPWTGRRGVIEQIVAAALDGRHACEARVTLEFFSARISGSAWQEDHIRVGRDQLFGRQLVLVLDRDSLDAGRADVHTVGE